MPATHEDLIKRHAADWGKTLTAEGAAHGALITAQAMIQASTSLLTALRQMSDEGAEPHQIVEEIIRLEKRLTEQKAPSDSAMPRGQ